MARNKRLRIEVEGIQSEEQTQIHGDGYRKTRRRLLEKQLVHEYNSVDFTKKYQP